MSAQIVQEERQKQIKSWEEYISDGLIAREEKDSSAWSLGDLAQGITTDYGEDSLGKYAYAISIEKKTLMNYRTVSGRFNKKIREEYKKLSFSHFSSLTGVVKPEAWLEKADTEEWSVEKLRKEIRKEYPNITNPKLDDEPPEVYHCPECGLWRLRGMSSFDICKGHYKISKKGELVYD